MTCVKCIMYTFSRHGPVTVPVVVVRGCQLVQFRLVPDEHVLGAGRPVVLAAGGRRRRRWAGTSTTAATTAAARADATTGYPPATERWFLILLFVDGHVDAGHEAHAGLLFRLYLAAIPSAAGHQRGPPPDVGLQLLPPNPSQRIGVSPPSLYTVALSAELIRRIHIIVLHTEFTLSGRVQQCWDAGQRCTRVPGDRTHLGPVSYLLQPTRSSIYMSST